MDEQGDEGGEHGGPGDGAGRAGAREQQARAPSSSSADDERGRVERAKPTRPCSAATVIGSVWETETGALLVLDVFAVGLGKLPEP